MRKVIKILFATIGVLIFCIVLFLFGLKRILDQSSVKSLVKEKIEHVINLKVNYSEISTVLLPFPGIELKEISVVDQEKRILIINRLLVEFDLNRILDREFQIRSIKCEGGEFLLERAEDGSFPIALKFKSDADEIEEGKEKVEEGPSALLLYLPKTISLSKFTINYEDFTNHTKQELHIQELELKFQKEKLAANLNLLVELNKNPISLNSQFNLIKDDWTLESVRTISQLTINQFQLSRMGDLIQIFPKANFLDSKIDLTLKLEKDSDDSIQLQMNKFAFSGVKSIKGELLPAIESQGNLDLNLSSKKISLKNIFLKNGDHTFVNLEGELFQDTLATSIFSLQSDRLDLDKVLSFVNLLSEPDLKRSSYFSKGSDTKDKKETLVKRSDPTPNLNLSFDMKKLRITGKSISYSKGAIELKENILTIKNADVGIFDGKTNANGTLHLKTKLLHVKAKLTGIDVEKAIASSTRDKLLKGRLRSDLVIDLNLNHKADIMRKLKLKSNFHIDRGQLLGYANFIKPVAEVGKVLNFSAKSGESTEFEAIDGSVYLANNQIQLNSFEMKGIGLNATGSGVYNAGGKIDMKFTVALAGVVGKAVKLPIIYKGYYGKNFAYIDPVWLATVYTGTMLGGPLGTVLGSMAGTQASERVDATIGTVKNTFGSIKGFFFDEKKDSKDKK